MAWSTVFSRMMFLVSFVQVLLPAYKLCAVYFCNCIMNFSSNIFCFRTRTRLHTGQGRASGGRGEGSSRSGNPHGGRHRADVGEPQPTRWGPRRGLGQRYRRGSGQSEYGQRFGRGRATPREKAEGGEESRKEALSGRGSDRAM